MRKRLIILLAAVFVVGIACAAYAEVQNVKVSGDITAEAIGRSKIMLRGSNQASIWAPNQTTFNQYDRQISGLLSHIRVRVDADLTDSVSATVRLINERMWGSEVGSTTDATSGATTTYEPNTNVGIDLAYATMKEFLYSPLTLTIGRQELHFGNDLIIGDVTTNMIMAGHTNGINAGAVLGTPGSAVGKILPRSLDDLTLRKSFDAIRATLNYDPLVIDGVYSRIDGGNVDKRNAVDLYGVNANYALDKVTNIEGYYWFKIRNKAGAASTTAVPQRSKNDTVHTLGVLGRYSGIKNLALSLELAYQLGEKVSNTAVYPDDRLNDGSSRHRRAYAIQLMSNYNLADLVMKKYDPTIGFNYTLLSGEAYKNNKKNWHGWDAMFENQAGGTLFNKIMGYSNAQLFNVSGSMKPMDDLKLTVAYSYIRLMRAYKNGNNAAGAVVGPNGVTLTGVIGDPTYDMKAGEKSLGNEIDAQLLYNYTEDVQLGLAAGWFIPGDAFADQNSSTASQIIGSMKVTF